MSDIQKILEDLSPAQLKATTDFEGPALIIAGAGSGKTRVLTSRIAYMISKGISPENILALTFTNKAAREMRERINVAIGAVSRYINMGTFHSVFSRILRQNAEIIGFPQNFTIYDASDQKDVVADILKSMNIDEKQYNPTKIISRISLAKNALITPAMYEANQEVLKQDKMANRSEFHNIYREYCLRCKRSAAMDFDDLLLRTTFLFRNHTEILKRYQEMFKYILVDEYQDTNIVQYMIINQLGKRYRNICVVGDDSQSIYAFRGANIENILTFKNDWPGCKEYKLEENYRSTKNIVEAANSLIEHNPKRLKKECFSSGERGEKILVLQSSTEKDEAIRVVEKIRQKILSEKGSFNDVAVLYRNHSQSRVLEEALRRFAIPYIIHKGTSFYSRKEIRNIIAYFRLIINERDDESLKRIINFPARGIGDTTLEKIEEVAKKTGVSLEQAINSIVASPQKNSLQSKLSPFIELIHDLRAKMNTMEMYEFGLEVAKRTGIIAHYSSTLNQESKDALDNVMELLDSITAFKDSFQEEADENTEPTFEKWLEYAVLSSEQNSASVNEESKGHVTLMTVHAAKGLEYKHVFIIGCANGIFPLETSMMVNQNIEEERRLFYVAMTRAERTLTISFPKSIIKWGSTLSCDASPFVKDIDTAFIENNSRDYTEYNLQKDYTSMNDVRPKNLFQTSASAVGASSSHGNLKRVQKLGNSTKRHSQFSKGNRIRHEKFGTGVIQEIEKTDIGIILTINFEEVGIKKLLEHLCNITKL